MLPLFSGMSRRSGAVHVATTTRVYKGRVYQTHLLRRTYREGGKVKHQTLGNLSHLPPDLIETIRRRLRGESSSDSRPWEIVRTFPHGHVLAALGTLKSVGLESILASRPSRERSLVIAMIVAQDPSTGLKAGDSTVAPGRDSHDELGPGIGLGTGTNRRTGIVWCLGLAPRAADAHRKQARAETSL